MVLVPIVLIFLHFGKAFAAPSITLNSPPDDSVTANRSMTLDFDISDPSPMTVKVYGDTVSNPDRLIYIEENSSGGNYTFDWEYPTLAPGANTRSLWHFDNSSGDTIYDAAGDNDGLLINGASITPSGRFGYAVEFDGVDDRITIPDDASLDIDSASGIITIEAWIYPHTTGSKYRTIVAKRELNGNPTNYQFSINASTGTLLFYSGHWPEVYVSSVSVPTNEWSYVAVSLDASEGLLRFYRNGVKEDSISNAVLGAANDFDLQIGYIYTNDQTFDGYMDEVRITDRLLSDTEIADNYQLHLARHYWKVVADNGTDSTVSDISNFLVDGPDNALPVLDPIGSKSITEGSTLTVNVTAYDIESTPSLTVEGSPSGAAFTDHGDGTGTFSWTPGYTESGIYNVTFKATDDSSAVDEEIVSIEVFDAGNQNPVLASIGAKSVTEGGLLQFTVSATDPESTPSLTVINMPSGASFNDHGDGSGTFSWTPGYFDSDVYSITFRATDDSSASDEEVVSVEVFDAGNQNPVLASIGSQSTTENINLTFAVSASDAESTPSLSAAGLPAGATFDDNGDGTGTFDWTPSYLQGGVSYDVTFTAADDSSATDIETVSITVNEAGNQLPILDPIGPRSITEGVELNIAVSAEDIEGDVVLSVQDEPSGSSFVDNGDGTGVLTWAPGYTEQGNYFVTFIVTDDSLATDDEIVQITVNEAGNQSPTLAAIGPRSITEGDLLQFTVNASDPESTPSLTVLNLPAEASFLDHGNGSGTFSWTPGFLESNIYNVTFRATDDSSAVDDEVVSIEVLDAGNQNPVLASIGAQSVTEGLLMQFTVSATDPESTPSLTVINAPSGSSFADHGNGTGTFSWTPGYFDSDVYSITFRATDDSTAIDEEIVSVEVFDAGNQNPVLASIGPKTTTEGDNLNFVVSATDIECVPSLTAMPLPSGADFIDFGNGTGSFVWNSNYLQSGIYDITFTAIDDSGGVDIEVVEITINDAGNRHPILAGIGDKNTTEGVNLNFSISATDVESTPVLSAEDLPEGAFVTDHGNGTATFDWTPDFLQSGDHDVYFMAVDDSGAVDFEVVTFSVADGGNRNPVLTEIGPQAADEGLPFTLDVYASDVESIPVLTASSLPNGAQFTDYGDGTGSFTWLPGYLDAGNHEVTFTATDDSSAIDYEVVAISIADAGEVEASLIPVKDTIALDSTVIITVAYDNLNNSIQPLQGFLIRIQFDPELIEIVDAVRGDLLGDAASEFHWYLSAVDAFVIEDLRTLEGGIIGQGTLAEFEIKALDGGIAPFEIIEFATIDTGGTYMETAVFNTSVTIDDVLPEMQVISEPENQYYLTPPVFSTFGFEDNWGLDAAHYQIDSYDPMGWIELFSGWQNPTWNNDGWALPGFSGLSGEPHTVYFMVTDAAGNSSGTEGELSWSFFKDETAPEIALVSPPFDSVSQDPFMELNFDVQDIHPATVWLYGDTLSSADKLMKIYTVPAGGSVLSYEMGELPFDVEPNTTVALWHFDDNAGTTLTDESASGNDGVLEGSPLWTSSGKFGNALELDGTDDYITVPDHPSLDIDSASGEFSFEAWIYPHQSSGMYRTILSKRSDVEHTNYQIGLNQSNGNLYFFSGHWPEIYVSDIHPSINQWSYIAVTLDATEGLIRFYYNGEKMDSIPDALFGQANNAPLEIGALEGGNQPFSGILDEIRLSNRILSDIEIRNRYQLREGDYYWRVEASDGTNHSLSEVSYFEVVSGPDTESPTIVVTSPEPDQLLNYIPTIEVHCHDNYGLDSAFYSPISCTSPIRFPLWEGAISRRDTVVYFRMPTANPGQNSFYFSVYDDAGHVNNDSCSYSWSFLFDPFGPLVDIFYPDNGGTFDNPPQLTIRITGNAGIDRAYFQVDGCEGDWIPIWDYNSSSNDTTIVLNTPYLSPAWHNVHVKALDDRGVANGDTCVHYFSYNFAPEGLNIELISPEAGVTYYDPPVLEFEMYASEGVDRAYYQIGGCQASWTEMWSYDCDLYDTLICWTAPDLGPGDHSIFFLLKDDAGNTTDTCDFMFWYSIGDFNCDCIPGEADAIDPTNILDIIHLINYKFKSGPEPIPYAICSGDVNCDCIMNILDIISLIDFKFKSGPAPCVCEDWVNNCGAPLE